MTTRPTLETQRLVLRPFALSDAPDVQRLAGDREIAATTLHIPHPYTEGMAEAWIGTHDDQFAERAGVVFAITDRAARALRGAIGLTLGAEHARAEMGYWIGRAYWGKGYCTEAARAVLRYAFEELDLHRVYATHLTRNPASGRVMQKVGMIHEGCLRGHIEKWGAFEDLEVYGILADEWRAQQAAAST